MTNTTTNQISKILLIAAALVSPQLALAKGDPQLLPLVLIGDTNSLSAPVANFYQATAESLRGDDHWHPVPRQSVLRHLHQTNSGIPTISAAEGSLAKKQMIPSAQRLVDTMALPGALLLECQATKDNQAITACQLGYYDAAKSKVTASTRKSFKVALHDASLWAPRLLASLRGGLSAHREQKMQAQIKTALNKVQTKPKPYKILLQTSGFGEQSGSNATVNSIAGFGLVAGLDSDFKYAGLLFEQGQGQGNAKDRTQSLKRQSYGLVFGVSSPAMSALLWDLGVTGGYSQRTSSEDGKVQVRQSQPFIGLRPGLQWRMNDVLSAGLYLSYRQYTGGSTTKTSQTAALSNHILGTGLVVSARF